MSVQPMLMSVCKGLVKINTDNMVNFRIKTNKKYVMWLPETDEVVYLNCYGVAMRAADLTILKHTKAGKPVTHDLNCTFGYQFENFDSVCFSSWNYREKCELYAIEDIFAVRETLGDMFLEDI